MDKIIWCKNCIYMYECQNTYLGGCSNGVEWEKEEKDDS